MQDLHCQNFELDWALDKIKQEPFEPENTVLYSLDNHLYSNTLHRRSSEASFNKRARPYPPKAQGSLAMNANTSNWSSNTGARGGRSHTPSHRSRGGQEAYPLGQSFMDAPYDFRSAVSSSSLTGAIGDAAHRSRSPPVRNDSLFHSNWSAPNQPPMLPTMGQNPSYSGAAGMSSLTYDMSTNLNYDSTMRDSSPDSNSSGSSHPMFDPYSHNVRQQESAFPTLTQPSHATFGVNDPSKAEIAILRQKLHEALEEVQKYRGMEMVQKPVFLPTPPPSAAFQQDWRARTEARTKIFCSLNRAGNALCAWHDSRRERRSFPPRNAPPGYLNCGCTHEEALFEESLARHAVGSYYPGESVRMDPALRNPLLKLLQERYGYQDGDFERNPNTGEWVKGEGAAYWEAQIQAGASSRRRVEADRH